MLRVAVVSGKGGVGKSTVCALLAAGWARGGLDVAVADRDPQQTLSSAVARGALGNVEVWDGKESHAVLVIDTPPRIGSRELLGAVLAADVVVVPVQAAPGDLEATAAVAATVKAHLRPGAKARLLFNFCRRTRADAFHREFAKQLGLPACRTTLGYREGARQFGAAGWSGLPRATRKEVEALCRELRS